MNFWVLIFIVNVAFFLGPYLINIKEDPNPFRHFYNKKMTLRRRLFLAPYFKSTSDPFKINFEFTVFIFAANLLGLSGFLVSFVGAIIGLITWIIIIYYAVIMFVFRRIPVLKSDIDLARIGLNMAKNRKPLIFLIAIIILLLIGMGSFWVTDYLLSFDPNVYFTLFILVFTLFAGLYKLQDANYKIVPYRTVFPSFNFLRRNIKQSKKFDYLHTKNAEYFQGFNDFEQINLVDKPNFRLLCLESYGSIVFKDKDFSDLNEAYQLFEVKLKEKGYSVVSGLSTPPLFAGGSWKSYSTLMYGTRISDDIQYDILFNGSEGFMSYQSLFHFFKRQGYYNVLVNGLSTMTDYKFDWSGVKKVFYSDVLHLCDEMGYKRELIKFYGGRDCLPDQYALNKGESLLRSTGKSPNTMYFMTLNSHIPFNSPTKVLKEWRKIDEQSENGSFVDLKLNTNDNGQKAKYKSSIRYSIEMLTNYIENLPDEDNIIVLFGDHQPPFITPTSLGLETPIHILTKNNDLLEPFIEQGFVDGFKPNMDNIPIKHEAFLSLFMNGMNQAYGENPELRIPYKPNGSIFE